VFNFSFSAYSSATLPNISTCTNISKQAGPETIFQYRVKQSVDICCRGSRNKQNLDSAQIHFCIAAKFVTVDNSLNSSMWQLNRCSFRHPTKALILDSNAAQCNAIKHANRCMIVAVLCCAVLCCDRCAVTHDGPLSIWCSASSIHWRGASLNHDQSASVEAVNKVKGFMKHL